MHICSAPGDGCLIRPAAAAAAFGVHVRTLRRWADDRKLTVLRTAGGHRRYVPSEVQAMAAARTHEAVAM